MRFTTSSAILKEALSSVAGASPSKTSMTILECALLERDGDRLCLSATDLDVSVIKRIDVHHEAESGIERIAVPARRLLDTLRALPELPVTFVADAEFRFSLTTDQGVYRMGGFDGADFPALPELSDGEHIESTGAILRRAWDKTGFAASTDSSRIAMTGICFQIDPDRGRAVATDGHRLVKFTLNALTSSQSAQFVVPGKAFSLAARVASDGACSIVVGTEHVSFDYGDTRVFARLIEARYPNYEAVIPRENDKRCVVHRQSLLSAIQRANLYASQTTRQIRLHFADNSLEVLAEDLERASEARETVVCEYDKEDQLMAFNGEYLVEVLRHLESEHVAFDLGHRDRAGIVTPLEQTEGEDIMMLIMPVMLSTYA